MALQTLEGSYGSVTVAFSPDGKQLVSVSGDKWAKVILWDMATRTPLQKLEGHSRRVNAVAFSSDSRQLASASASEDSIVRL